MNGLPDNFEFVRKTFPMSVAKYFTVAQFRIVMNIILNRSGIIAEQIIFPKFFRFKQKREFKRSFFYDCLSSQHTIHCIFTTYKILLEKKCITPV